MEKSKKYITLDNGGRPFLVILFPKSIDIYTRTEFEHISCCGKSERIVWKYFTTLAEYEKVFIGNGQQKGFDDGNSILVRLDKTTYWYIGWKIIQFSLVDDEIIAYESPVGSNDVPYPYAVSKTKTYLMLECKYIDNEYLNNNHLADPYDACYDENMDKHFVHSFESTLVHKRLK